MTGNRSRTLHDALEDDILTGALRPGARLDEQRLAARFGVSRTPIREALKELAASGLLQHVPHRGSFVASIGPRRLIEMFDVMAEMEAMCARLAARRMTPEDKTAITRAHEACSAAAKADDHDTYYYENERFHEYICRAGHNEFLAEQTNALRRRLKPYRRLQLRVRNRIAASLAEHGRIVAALSAGEGEKAAAEMRGHVTVQGQRFTDLIASLETA